MFVTRTKFEGVDKRAERTGYSTKRTTPHWMNKRIVIRVLVVSFILSFCLILVYLRKAKFTCMMLTARNIPLSLYYSLY